MTSFVTPPEPSAGDDDAQEGHDAAPVPSVATPDRSQGEYEAIRQAMMETSRGRWFLDEFARANRNADTKSVLAAVARLEQALIEKPAPAAAPQPASATDPIADVDLAALRDGLRALEDSLAARLELAKPVIRSIDNLQNMVWTLREGGADVRICNLLATQSEAIGKGHAALSAADAGMADALAHLSRALTAKESGSGEASATTHPEAGETPADSQHIDARNLADATLDAALPAIAEAMLEQEPFPPELPESPNAASEDVRQDRGRSLGEAVLESGLVSHPSLTNADTLARLRRMSQAEKTAFFS